MAWCYAAASVVGLSHIRAGSRLQDAQTSFVANHADGTKSFCAVISDGAGSAEFGGQGASIICRTIASEVRHTFRNGSVATSENAIWSWLDLARDRIQLASQKRGRTPRDFAATLVLVIASHKEIITAHVGDGAIVARDKDSASWTTLSEPHHGEYAATTYFVTDDPQPSLRIRLHPNCYDALAAFSDGIENLVIDRATGEPSAAFFDPMAKPLDASAVVGRDQALCKGLSKFLASDRLNERTDDDKTLVIAVAK